MIRKLTASVCLGFALIVSGAATVRGDVSGNFDLDIVLIPDGVQTEAVKFNIDLRSNLEVNVTLSGLTLGVDAGFGNTGPEFSIANLSAALGPVTLFNQLVFATPFFNKTQAVSVSGKDLGPTVNSVTVNGLTFVKARFGLNFDVAGFTISNLAILEDVDFPNPLTYIQPAYYTEGLDAIVDVGGTGNVNQTPTLGFGNLITLQGQTRNRVTVTGATGLCVRPQLNLIKGRSWPQSVDPGCGDLVFFSFETLSVSGLVLFGFDVELDVTWTPRDKTAVSLAGSSNFQASASGDVNDRKDLNFILREQISDKSSLDGGIGYSKNNFEGLFRRTDNAGTHIGVGCLRVELRIIADGQHIRVILQRR